ncbi:MAG: GNAT family N-acetyltransferase [Deltaproteobacteria bacterium]|nr:GNAT family N-acetyltransferase [Deltaproteobacteria bacterium]
MITVHSIDNLDRIHPLEAEWNNLLILQKKESTVFYTPEWYRCWWQTFGQQNLLRIFLIRENEELIGIAPMMIRRQRNRGFPIRMFTFVENGNSLHNDFLLHPEKREKALRAILDHLMAEKDCWDLVEFKNIPENSRNCDFLRKILKDKNFLYGTQPALISPYITINSDWESYYKSRSSKARKTLRNIRNRFKRERDFSVQEINDYATFQSIAPELYEIARNSWTEEIGDSLSSPANRRFFDQLSRVAAEKGWLSVWLLKVKGDPVAFEYHLKYNDKIYGMRASHKKDYGRMSPGVFLDAHIVQQLFEKGEITEYDLGGSSDHYKEKWTRNCRRHINVHLFNVTLYSKLLYGVEYRFIPAIKRILRKSA